MLIFKIDLAPANKMGLTWGKQSEMKQKSADVIEAWLEKQGKVTLLSSRNFYISDGKEIAITFSTNQPLIRNMGSGKTYDHKETGNSLQIKPTISDKTIDVIIHLSITSLEDQLDSYVTQQYSLGTQLSISDGKTLVIDDVMSVRKSGEEEETSKTALVILITPHILR